jgi:transcription elongation GreA/GreB family factor
MTTMTTPNNQTIRPGDLVTLSGTHPSGRTTTTYRFVTDYLEDPDGIEVLTTGSAIGRQLAGAHIGDVLTILHLGQTLTVFAEAHQAT